MGPADPEADAAAGPRRVLVVVEDAALGELLEEALGDAGHAITRADGLGPVDALVAAGPFDAAIVDLDTRARWGPSLIAELRAKMPSLTVIALLPCGGLPSPHAGYHLALEKPARLASLLAAVAGSRRD